MYSFIRSSPDFMVYITYQNIRSRDNRFRGVADFYIFVSKKGATFRDVYFCHNFRIRCFYFQSCRKNGIHILISVRHLPVFSMVVLLFFLVTAPQVRIYCFIIFPLQILILLTCFNCLLLIGYIFLAVAVAVKKTGNYLPI